MLLLRTAPLPPPSLHRQAARRLVLRPAHCAKPTEAALKADAQTVEPSTLSTSGGGELCFCQEDGTPLPVTRFDTAVRALRGEFDPPASVANTEMSLGLITESLVGYPHVYDFQFVLRVGSEDPAALLQEMRKMVDRVCGTAVRPEDCTATLRAGGKYVSLRVPATVSSAVDVPSVMAALEGDPRVLMKF